MPARTPVPSLSRFPLFRLLLGTQVTRARVLALLGLGAVGVVVGVAIGLSGDAPREVIGEAPVDLATRGARFVNTFGLSLLVPVSALVFAAASLGDLSDDGSLVYLWLRPVRRSRIALAAAVSSFAAAWPIVVVPLGIAAWATGGGSGLVLGTVAAATVALVAYTGLFCALGLRVKRSLVWGLLYVFIWEGFIATANETAARLAVRTYARSVLSSVADVELRFSSIGSPWRWAVPIAIAVAALWYAARRLAHQDVA
jgi:ABC-2 type transport system permease protein